MPGEVIVGLTHHAGLRLAELGFLIIVVSGLWLVAMEIPMFRTAPLRWVVAGLGLTAAGVLLIIAVHWGHVG